jgi:hypothetical protein
MASGRENDRSKSNSKCLRAAEGTALSTSRRDASELSTLRSTSRKSTIG